MIKSVIKLVIAVAVANALWHVTSAYLSHYRFTDAIHELAIHSAGRSDSQVREKVVELAATYDAPLDTDAIAVRRDEHHTFIDGSYTKAVSLFPGFDYQWPFALKVDGFVIPPPPKLD